MSQKWGVGGEPWGGNGKQGVWRLGAGRGWGAVRPKAKVESQPRVWRIVPPLWTSLLVQASGTPVASYLCFPGF